jgi:hypothetical protein
MTDLDTPGTAYLQRLLAAGVTTTLPPVPDDQLYLPDAFWAERRYLSVIAGAAWAHLASPDAVLHAILARTAAFAGRGSHIDAGLGRSPLNYFTAILAPSGVGKSVATGIAEQLLPAPESKDDAHPPLDGINIGSGEGIAEAYMGDTKEPNPSGKGRPITVRQQVRWSVYFEVDEGEVLTKLMHERQGSTLGVALRTAWSGKTLGQANATAERTRRVTKYSMGLVVGFQPQAAGPLFREAPLGTPQRFAWAIAKPQTVPAYDERAEWTPTTIQPHGWGQTWRILCDEPIRRDVYQQRIARPYIPIDPLDTHQPLMLMKLAGLLAILDGGRQRVTTDDWRLANTIWDTSRRVRTWAQAQLDADRDAEETRIAEARSRQVITVNNAVHAATVERVALRLSTCAAAAFRPVTASELHRRLTSRDRGWFDEALQHAVSNGWINHIPPVTEDDKPMYADGPVPPPTPPKAGKANR